MDDRELPRILGRCLDDIAGGATPSACLARYPEHAAELAPLLHAANEVAALGGYRLSDGARTRARARLRQAEAARARGRPAPFLGWLRLPAFALPRAAVGLAIALLCVMLTTGIVAASQPGNPAYGVRVAVERAPALLAPGAEARARAELRIAARRMAELDRTMTSQEQEVDPRTLDALLVSTEAAASLAASLPETEQAEVAARMTRQAEQLALWERAARHQQQGLVLAAAYERMHRAALRAGEGLRQPQPVVPKPGPAETPLTGLPTITPTRTPARTARPTATSTLRPATTTPAPVAPTPRAERRSGSPTIAATESSMRQQGTRSAERTPAPARQGSPATAPAIQPTSPGPGPQPTSPGPGPQPTGAGPVPTSPGPRAEPTSPGPGPQPTSPGPGSEATPAGPGPDPTSPGNGPGGPPANTPGPRNQP